MEQTTEYVYDDAGNLLYVSIVVTVDPSQLQRSDGDAPAPGLQLIEEDDQSA